MTNSLDKLKTRLEAAKDIYADSPQVQVTYCDLRRLYEDILQVVEMVEKKEIGFK